MTPDDSTDVLEPELEARLRRGLGLLAAQTPDRRSRRPLLAAAAAAALLAAAGIGVGLAINGSEGQSGPQQAGPSAPPIASTSQPGGGPTTIGQGVSYDLARLVDESPRILVGTVTNVSHGDASDASGGLPYVLAEVSVDHTLKGADTAHVVAFDYDYGGTVTANAPHGATFAVGQQVLLFLSSSAGTVHADLPPLHWQVTGGAAGEYRMRGDEPEAPFTIAEIERRLGQ